jgi:small subunit ribosomal protein S9
LLLTGNKDRFDMKINVRGGGIAGQAGAVTHGIAKALVGVSSEYREVLKKAGLIRRDSRIKERKKYGRRGARARFQFSKR